MTTALTNRITLFLPSHPLISTIPSIPLNHIHIIRPCPQPESLLNARSINLHYHQYYPHLHYSKHLNRHPHNSYHHQMYDRIRSLHLFSNIIVPPLVLKLLYLPLRRQSPHSLPYSTDIFRTCSRYPLHTSFLFDIIPPFRQHLLLHLLQPRLCCPTFARHQKARQTQLPAALTLRQTYDTFWNIFGIIVCNSLFASFILPFLPLREPFQH
ncbi:unnamed protein product [Protopolystoma xenopodis]|uniref:Uncharacterized protein n=1 Tax=Protopolystoma xenopodis TaxID=117903 RepID=A0A3S5BZ49_9PLAT|nr:unnamed protein product [Protopolystoma xenopodis]